MSERTNRDESQGTSEEELLKYRDRLDTVLQATPIPIFAKDREGRFLFFNSSFERYFGLRGADLIGKTAAACWGCEDARADREREMDLMAGDTAQMYEHPMNVAGEKRDLVFHEACFHGPDGAVAGLVGAIVDVTRQRKLERERRQLDAKIQQTQRVEGLGVLAGGIAHDFNNLLMTILGNADLAAGSLPADSPLHGYLDDIMRASRRAADLCNQMLAYAGKGRNLVGPIDVNGMVSDMRETFRSSAGKGVSIRLEIASDEIVARGDAEQVRQVLLNLVLNASDAIGSQDGTINVRTGAEVYSREALGAAMLGEEAPEGVYTYVEVADTGCGMDSDTRTRMFDPFFTTKFMGRGLGMAAVLGIVRAHHGAIEVQSEPGRGSRVRVLLPACAKVKESPESLTKRARTPPCARKILLADDEESLRELLSCMLKRSGFDVVTASNGREALTLFDRHADEVVCAILDVSMPLMDGFETLRNIKQRAAHIPVILSSGYARAQVDERLGAGSVDGFIQKPYDWHTLSREVDRVLRTD